MKLQLIKINAKYTVLTTSKIKILLYISSCNSINMSMIL